MKQECPTYLKSIGKSKALAATLSDIELEADSKDSDQEGIVSTFTATIESTKGEVEVVDDEEELMESKLDDQDDIHIAYAKVYKVSEKNEKLYKLAARNWMKS